MCRHPQTSSPRRKRTNWKKARSLTDPRHCQRPSSSSSSLVSAQVNRWQQEGMDREGIQLDAWRRRPVGYLGRKHGSPEVGQQLLARCGRRPGGEAEGQPKRCTKEGQQWPSLQEPHQHLVIGDQLPTATTETATGDSEGTCGEPVLAIRTPGPSPSKPNRLWLHPLLECLANQIVQLVPVMNRCGTEAVVCERAVPAGYGAMRQAKQKALRGARHFAQGNLLHLRGSRLPCC
mmetsp:Transcript_40209/g.129141  ORF Transcript_40209/g.129141 Transcript_40209/m.129141 type:complete len:233 (+) Transcript_40209:208-906(+)